MTELRILREHVIQSNAIEGIRRRHGSLYTNHLATARAVAADPARYVFDLPAIHRRMFGGLPRPRHCGRHRLCGAMIVGQHTRQHLPPAREIPALMQWYYELVEHCLTRSPDYNGTLAMHAVSLCIHPFTDGNGRATRLHLNAMRLTVGLDWLVIPFAARGRYYRYIRDQETQFFPEFRRLALLRDT